MKIWWTKIEKWNKEIQHRVPYEKKCNKGLCMDKQTNKVNGKVKQRKECGTEWKAVCFIGKQDVYICIKRSYDRLTRHRIKYIRVNSYKRGVNIRNEYNNQKYVIKLRCQTICLRCVL